ncbi:MAG TPA: DUF1576 domain-containing protein [Anaerolineae bacterium]|nr:DUF1576 domain-containing protein [Anaerolineae bacterium]
MNNYKEMINRKRITALVFMFSVICIATGFSVNTYHEILAGELKILTSPGILITDYIALANLGAALVNMGMVTIIGLILAWIVDARFNGLLLAAIFTLAGFSMFGKNPFNILPIFIGVYLYDRYFSHQPMKDLIAPLLFGTTLGPIVSQVAFGFNLGLKGIFIGIALGIISGVLLAALMKHIYSFHLGYNLYNTGTTGGFVGVVVYMMMRGFGYEIKSEFLWSTDYTNFLSIFTLIFLIGLITIGFVWKGSFSKYKKIINTSGRLATDFVDITDLGTSLINMGLVGFIALGYVLLIKGDINGPIIAGILTVVGFGALGKHPRNILPVMLGVYLICIPKIWLHTDPGPLLASLFCTTLAPISGKFGFFAGLIAGMLHLPMVMHVGGLHGYMNLYNNGFAGGLAMLMIIGFIKGLRPHLLEN